MRHPLPPPPPTRRRVLVHSLAAAGQAATDPRRGAAGGPTGSNLVADVARLATIRVARIERPATVAQLVAAVRGWPGAISVGGARYSMGGQVALEGSLHLDLRGLDRLVWFHPEAAAVRVQAGMRWRDLQDWLDPAGLAVRTMQSYANFTIGGSVSVNAHGRYVGHGPVGHSVRALQLVLADGRVVEASRERHPDLFRAAIGGYGGVGVITEVELDLDRNARVERHVTQLVAADYPAWFRREVLGRPGCLLHNADLLPPDFGTALAISWRFTQAELTERRRLTPRGQDYGFERAALWAASELPNGAQLQRDWLRPAVLRAPAVVWRNHEASLDAASLAPRTGEPSTYALQEYFVPVARFHGFQRALAAILQRHDSRVLNVSVRHSPLDRDALLPYAPEEVFSFVLFHKLRRHPEAQAAVAGWTRELVQAALDHGGTYYLPYQRHATQAQFEAAYPGVARFRAVKARVDPAGRFSNALWGQYLQGPVTSQERKPFT